MRTKENKKLGMVVGAVGIICALVVAFISISAGLPDNYISERLQLAQSYIDELDYEQAIACLEEIVRIDPKNVDAYLMLADAYVEMGDPASAIEVLTNACKQVQDERLDDALEELKEEIISETELTEIALDSRFEACIVDGVRHAGYKKYDLTKEEREIISTIIQLVKAQDWKTVHQEIELDKLLDICKKHSIFVESDNMVQASLWCAFDTYKVFFEYILHANGISRTLAIIPLGDEDGYFAQSYSHLETDLLEKMESWGVSECKNGMYEGDFSYTREMINRNGECQAQVINGTMRNGLLDGRIFYKDIYLDYTERYIANFDMGRPEIFEKADNEDGTYTYYYKYGVDENGEALLLPNGMYAKKSGLYNYTEEQIKACYMFWGVWSFSFEDNVIYCYNY